MTYFDHLHTVADIKQEYRRLALLHHPDRPGGDTATMQAINAQYHAALERCDGQTSTGSDGNDHTYTYNATTEAAIMAKIAELIAAGVPRVADVYIIGTWVWIVGETRPIKEELKALGCRWHRKRACWYWHPHPYRHHYNRRAGLGDLAAFYGASQVAAEDRNDLAA